MEAPGRDPAVAKKNAPMNTCCFEPLPRPSYTEQTPKTLPKSQHDRKRDGAREKTRTFTGFRPLEPESSASTNSATRAHSQCGTTEEKLK